MRTIHIVGCEGYARTLISQSEKHAARSECALGCVIVDPEVHGVEQAAVRGTELKAQGWTVCSSLEELVASGYPVSRHPGTRDVLSLPLPIHLHLPFVLQGLDAGFDVLCEKPAAGTVAEVQQMEDAAAQAEGELFFGFQHVLTDALEHVSRLLQGEAIGDVPLGALIQARAMVLWPRPDWYYQRNQWAGRLTLSGPENKLIRILDSPAQNAGAHFLHALLETSYSSGWAPDVVEAVHLRGRSDIDSADTQFFHITTRPVARDGQAPSRVSAPELTFAISHAIIEEVAPCVEWHCEHGIIRWAFPDTLEVENESGVIYRHEGPLHGPDLNGVALARAIQPGDPESRRRGVPAASALLHTAVIEAAFSGISPDKPVPQATQTRYHRIGEHGITEIVGVADAVRKVFHDNEPVSACLPDEPVVRVRARVGQ